MSYVRTFPRIIASVELPVKTFCIFLFLYCYFTIMLLFTIFYYIIILFFIIIIVYFFFISFWHSRRINAGQLVV